MTADGITGTGATGGFGPSRPDRLMGPAAGTTDAGSVATEFAGLFYAMMLDEMEKTVPKNEYFGGKGEEAFRSLWVDELGRRMAERRGDPLATVILRQIERNGGGGAPGRTS